MNCDECKEQVLELIDTERTDPDSVREVLARCPECRALFEELKTTLRLAAQLPLEEPSASVDDAVLGAVNAHTGAVAPLELRRFRPAPWAAAAVALLAVSVGVWSIPEPEAPMRQPELDSVAVVEAEDEREEAATPRLEPALEPRDTSAGATRSMAKKATRPAAAPSPRQSQPRREAARRADLDEEAASIAGDAALAVEAAYGPAVDRGASDEEELALPSACEALLARVGAKGGRASGEEALALGRCYRDAEDYARARHWLERAADDPKTRKRAKRVLKSLPVD